MKQENSKKYFQEACQYIPGGVNSPVRAFQSVHRDAPIFAKKRRELIFGMKMRIDIWTIFALGDP